MALSYQERYDRAGPSSTRVNEKRFADLEAGSMILVPSPQDIESEIARLDEGDTITFGELRVRLTERYGGDGSCPAMTGMHLRIVAELALEALDAGVQAEAVTPVWRVIDPTSPLAAKLPGGEERIRALRQSDRTLQETD